MLKGVHPLIGPELLFTLASMGHGDEIVIVDRNFPAMSMNSRVHRLDGVDVVSAASAIFSLLPLDSFVESPLECMEIVGRSGVVNDVQREVLAVASGSADRTITMTALDRSEFYTRTRRAYAVIATGEERPFGCFIVTKGVLPDFVP
jgi:L-fucose mutarotase